MKPSAAWTAGLLSSLGFLACTPEPAPVEPIQTTIVPQAPTASSEVVVAPQPAPKPKPVELHLFMVAHDPFVARLFPDLADVVRRFGSDVTLKIDYLGWTTPEGTLSAMHGPNEVAANMAQICAIQSSPKWIELIDCDLEKRDWRACASKLGIDEKPLEACINGAAGPKLLSTSIETSKTLKATGSPTLLINGGKYDKDRRKRSLMHAICDAAPVSKLAACSSISDAPTVKVTVLTDARCNQCSTNTLEAQIKSSFNRPEITSVDYGSPEGKALFAAVKPLNLPAAVFDDSLAADKEASTWFTRLLKPHGARKAHEMGDWNPLCADPKGCALEECKLTATCRAEVAKTLDVFIMSKCPYGAKALIAMKEVLSNFKKAKTKIAFNVSYIGDGDAKAGFTSMRGAKEVEEDLRAVCAIKHYAKDEQFLTYLACRAENLRSDDWLACTGGATGVQSKVIKDCAEGTEGKDLLAASFTRAHKSNVKASPSWFVNGKFTFKGLDAETIKSNVCFHNKLAGCDAKLSGTAPSTPPGPPP